MHGAANEYSESTQGQRRVGRGVGAVQVVVQENWELELGDDEGMGEGDGGEAEGDVELQRRRDAKLGEWASSRTDRIRGGERAEGVGGPGGARRAHHFRLSSAWRERPEAHTVQVSLCLLRFQFDGPDFLQQRACYLLDFDLKWSIVVLLVDCTRHALLFKLFLFFNLYLR